MTTTTDVALTSNSLVDALKAAREKLVLYRQAHSGEYIGGPEFTALIHQIDRAIGSKANAGETCEQRDAKRYRYLRACGAMDDITVESGSGVGGVYQLRDELLDSRVDAAIEAERGSQKAREPRMVECGYCHGDGRLRFSGDMHACEKCGGTGQVKEAEAQ